MKKSYKNLGQLFINSLICFVLVANPAITFASEINEENVLRLINNERAERGFEYLSLDVDLDRAANLKSKDMINRNYFEHYAFGLKPWDFMQNAGYNYLYAGENLAMHFNTAEGMVDAWMDSKSHRDNILNPDFEDTGIGIVKGTFIENGTIKETTMVTNMFGRKKPKILEFFNSFVSTFRSFF